MSIENILTIIAISVAFVASAVPFVFSLMSSRHQLPRLKITCNYAYCGATGLPKEVVIPHPMSEEYDIPPEFIYEFMYYVTKIEFRIINDSSAPVTISDIELSSLVFMHNRIYRSNEYMIDSETFKERYETSLYENIDCKKFDSATKEFFREAKIVCYYYFNERKIWKDYHPSSRDLLISLPVEIGPYKTKDVVAYFATDSRHTGIYLFNRHFLKSKLIIKSAHGSLKKKIDIDFVEGSHVTGCETSYFKDKDHIIAPALYNGPVDHIK